MISRLIGTMQPRVRAQFAEFAVDRSQSEVIGVVLLLAVTIMGSGLILVVGTPALDGVRDTVHVNDNKHVMTQLDSRAAIVALGHGDSQTVALSGSGAGRYYIDDDAGRAVISHHNYSGSGNTEILANFTLGAVIYEKDETQIAYQGGGVWQSRGPNSTMVSPPELQYRSATLTFPVIQINGSDSAGGGRIDASIERKSDTLLVFPNESTTYSTGSKKYVNPIREGNVSVTIHSKYYHAWAAYFSSRTTANVTVDSTNETVTMELQTAGTLGDFDMPTEGNSITVPGLDNDGHPVSNFTITLFDDDQDSADFSNLKWSMYADEGSKKFELHLRDNSGGVCGGDVRLTVYYTDNNGANYSSWTNGSAYQYECESAGNDFNNDGDTDDKRLVANFTALRQIRYDEINGGDGVIMHYSVSGSDTFDDPTDFNEHAGSVSWESKSFSDGDETTMYNVTNHYLSLLGPTADLTVDDKPGNTVNEEASYGTIEVPGASQKLLTFFHITKNEVRVELD